MDNRKNVAEKTTGAKSRVHLTETQQTMLLTLYGKALDYNSKDSILSDSFASEILEKVDVDYQKYANPMSRIIAIRARHFDEWTRDFLSKNKKAVVVNLGCGLDTRVSRIAPASSVLWYDVDFSEVIALRRKFFKESDTYTMLSSSITEDGWLKKIPSDRPALIIAEGVFSYITETEVGALLKLLTDYFSHGEIAFNVISELVNKNGSLKARGLQQWTTEDLEAVDALDPKLTRKETVSRLQSKYIKKLPLKYRVILGLLGHFKKYKNADQLLRYCF